MHTLENWRQTNGKCAISYKSNVTSSSASPFGGVRWTIIWNWETESNQHAVETSAMSPSAIPSCLTLALSRTVTTLQPLQYLGTRIEEKYIQTIPKTCNDIVEMEECVLVFENSRIFGYIMQKQIASNVLKAVFFV